MKHVYPQVMDRFDSELLLRLDAAAANLDRKLARLDLQRLPISEYTRRYLAKIVDRRERFLQNGTFLLALALEKQTLPLDALTLADYGGGSGMIAFLAGELGVGTVLYNDIYDVACHDAETVARALPAQVSDFICGDMDDLVRFIVDHGLSVHALVSSDVIEHIYDIRSFFGRMGGLSSGTLRGIHATAANGRNPLLAWRLQRRHILFEHRNRQTFPGWKDRDTPRSYREIRREMIAEKAPLLSAAEVDLLARRTRGLHRTDIERCIQEYRSTGGISYRPDHITNTCDPHTGNWAERLMRPESLEEMLRNEGYAVRILAGFWPRFPSMHRRVVSRILNAVIRLTGRRSLFLAPSYVIVAETASGSTGR